MKFASFIFASITALSASTPHSSDAKHWSYNGIFSPENWGKISKTCSAGKSQTPINIETSKTIPTVDRKDILKFYNYKTSLKTSVINNGHTIKITPKFLETYNEAYITIDGVRYNLLQFHMHTHSENRIDGKQSDLVAHLVHQSYDGKLAVVAIFFDEGEENSAIKEYWNQMPQKVNEVNSLFNVDISRILPADKSSYFTFMGSLTTPPCTENVKWFILKDRQTISKDQIEALRTIYPHNFRPVQNINSRTIFER